MGKALQPACSFSISNGGHKYGCQLSCERNQEISCTKGVRLALHQVLADKLYVSHLRILGTTIKLSMLFKFWGCDYSLERNYTLL